MEGLRIGGSHHCQVCGKYLMGCEFHQCPLEARVAKTIKSFMIAGARLHREYERGWNDAVLRLAKAVKDREIEIVEPGQEAAEEFELKNWVRNFTPGKGD